MARRILWVSASSSSLTIAIIYDFKSNQQAPQYTGSPQRNFAHSFTQNRLVVCLKALLHILVKIDNFLSLLVFILNTCLKTQLQSMQLKSLPVIKSGFFVSISKHTLEGKFCLRVYLLRCQTDELFLIDIDDSAKVASEDGQVWLSPKRIADVIERKYQRVAINELAEMEIQLDVQGERVTAKMPPPRRDDTHDAPAEIRIRHIKRSLNERISLLEERNARLQSIVQSLQRELRQQSQQRLPELSPLLQARKSSSTIDEKTQGILRQYQENREFASMIRQHIEQTVSNMLRKDSQKRQDIVNQAIDRVSQIVDRNMREIYGKIEVLEQKLHPACLKIQQKAPKKGQIDPFAYFQALEESEYNSIQTSTNGASVQIRNNPRPVNDQNDIYCYFLSKPPITHTLTLHLKVLKGKKPLFGVCSKEALQARPIYKHSTAFFHILSDEKCWLEGQEQYDFDEGGRVEGGDDAVMRVSMEERSIVWESQGKIFKYEFNKDLLNQIQLHVAVLMKRQDENEVLLEYNHH